MIFLFSEPILLYVPAFISKDTITGFCALAKQLLQTTLFVLFPHFSDKRSAKIMKKGAHYNAKMNPCPIFRRNFRQTCT